MSHNMPSCSHIFPGKCSLVWLEASSLCSTIINTGYRDSSRLSSAVLVLPSGVEILQLWMDRNGPLHRLQKFIGGVDVEVGISKP